MAGTISLTPIFFMGGWQPAKKDCSEVEAQLDDITFTENGRIEASKLNALYVLAGRDPAGRRTSMRTAQMLRASRYYVAAHTRDGKLVGFARVGGDTYVAQVLDLLIDPAWSGRGVATRCMIGVMAHLLRSDYVTVTLTDAANNKDFFERFGFRAMDNSMSTFVWQRGKDE